MAEGPEPGRIPRITSYDAARRADVAPPPLPVPPKTRMSRGWRAAIVGAVLVALLVVCGVPAWLFTTGVREVMRQGSDPALPEAVREGPEGELVRGAELDAELRAAMADDYPAWRFESGELRRETWKGGGTQTWHVTLESVKHDGVQLAVSYTQTIDGEARALDDWFCDADLFQKDGTPPSSAEALLERFARDVTARPALIYAVYEPSGASGAKPVYEIAWVDVASGTEAGERYRLDAPGRWTRLASSGLEASGPGREVPADSVSEKTVAGATVDGDLRRVLDKEYAGWRVAEATKKQDRWKSGGVDMWYLRLESRRHPGVMLDVVYSKDVDAAPGKMLPPGWNTSEDVFRTGSSYKAGTILLDAFASDVATRPVVIGGRAESKPGDPGRTLTVDYRDPGGGAWQHVTYLQLANGSLTRRP